LAFLFITKARKCENTKKNIYPESSFIFLALLGLPCLPCEMPYLFHRGEAYSSGAFLTVKP